MDFLDVSLIRDGRTGKHARLPKDTKLRDTITMGSMDVPLEEKMVTICYGTDLVNVQFINFAANSRDVAREWCANIFSYATNLISANLGPMASLEKAYAKLYYVTNADGKIAVKNIIRLFSQHKDDRKRVEKALEAANLSFGKNDSIAPENFSFDVFLTFYRHLCTRNEVDKIFYELGAKQKPYLTAEQFKEFLNAEQRDPRLNEILYPYFDIKRAQAIIDQYEPNGSLASKGHLTQEGFLRYLMSEENALVPPEKYDLSHDMDQPLAHYFINSSHNTYLTGHQLTGRSSVEMYRQTLLTGCRCIELDCWDGKGADEEPIITHGYTMCTEISFKEVIEAIAESAFKVSDYPVILSFENHCSPRQQAKMAAHCRNIFGDMLLVDALDSHPLKHASGLPSPELLKRKILIKIKRKHKHRVPKPKSKDSSNAAATQQSAISTATEATSAETSDGVAPTEVDAGDGSESDTSMEDSDEDDDVTGLTEEEEKRRMKEKKERGTAGQEAEAGMEMSELVNYIQPVHFHSFESAEKRNRSYECSSFVETQATNLLKELPVEFVNYNKRQLSRIYPKGTRVDSGNYLPQVFWNAGCQFVALNFQTLDLAMQLNLGLFEYNNRSGYMLKPECMRRKDRHFDPFAESTVDGIVANTVELRVISGQLLSDRRVSTYVEVDMYGIPADTVRKKFRTKTVPNNGINPIYGEEAFVFKKVVLPALAILRIAVLDENNRTLLGHRVLPVDGLRPGYRHICLRNECNQRGNMASLFVYINVRDYIPDSFAQFAAALANPIAYQSNIEKHTQQLSVFDEFDVDQQDVNGDDKEDSIRRDRNQSVISKSSDGPPISRGGSQHGQRPHMDKQQSTVSTNSQQAASAGAASKISSLPNSPHHQGENGGVKQPKTSNKIDVIKITRLKNAEVVPVITIETLQECRNYSRVVMKLEKDLDSLKKKHDKARASLIEVHQLQEEKLLVNQVKNKNAVEKLHRKASRRASKKGLHPNEGMAEKAKGELSVLMEKQEEEHRTLKQTQQESLLELIKCHLNERKELQLRYVPNLFATLETLCDSKYEEIRKKLDDLHNKEVNELKKRLDVQSREEMKNLVKKHKDKNELAREKKARKYMHYVKKGEFRDEVLRQAKKEVQELKDMLVKRQREMDEKREQLKSALQDEKRKREEEINEEFDRDWENARLEVRREPSNAGASEATNM
ncbi:DgyrCDS10491 [Dimorphilus gyrociliatus]|uniref:1-phosphatidylinositol 4,5-bisphosphate phosphodiesterase n=1 Tax=Dimorphilus gyrociliatus TaxID=2664684 RepID=A0A7I8W0C1_9ANNE|nr:DgyrCDS10491 [Dimorphilus gyrociliatus]